MTFSDLNLLGVIVAFFVSFISGAIWFGPKTFYPIWMKAKGNASGQLTTSQNKPVLLFGGTILGVLIQTLTLGLIINSLGKNIEVGVLDGAGIGFALGVGAQNVIGGTDYGLDVGDNGVVDTYGTLPPTTFYILDETTPGYVLQEDDSKIVLEQS